MTVPSKKPSIYTRAVESGFLVRQGGVVAHIMTDVDTDKSAFPLSGYFFISGFMSAISFSATFVWGSFMTGNWAQLALALPRLFEGSGSDRDLSFHLADQQALACLLAFFTGILMGRPMISNLFGGFSTRLWLFVGTLFQAICTAAAAIAIWQSRSPSIAPNSGQPAWSNGATFVGLVLLSFTMGLQGAMARSLNTPFGATVVLTSTFVELLSDPHLFHIRRHVITRDSRLAGALALAFGAFTGRALVWEMGAGETLGVGAGIRAIIAISWIFVPGKPMERCDTMESTESADCSK